MFFSLVGESKTENEVGLESGFEHNCQFYFQLS